MFLQNEHLNNNLAAGLYLPNELELEHIPHLEVFEQDENQRLEG